MLKMLLSELLKRTQKKTTCKLGKGIPLCNVLHNAKIQAYLLPQITVYSLPKHHDQHHQHRLNHSDVNKASTIKAKAKAMTSRPRPRPHTPKAKAMASRPRPQHQGQGEG